VFCAIGIGFGAVLEMAGFGDSRKLAAQFYFKEMTVLKVMFTAIIVACVLIYLSSAFGLLDFSRVWVNPTYLASGIVGGLVMGVGFIVGGFCPGTSLVAASTLKIDGIFFVLGALVGVYLFGESVGHFEPFYLSAYLGRFTLPDWLGLPAGVVVLLVVLMALTMFWGGEIAEAYFGQKRAWSEIRLLPHSKTKISAVAILLSACLALIVRGQPSPEQRWDKMATAGNKLVEGRAIFVHPAEVVDLKTDTSLAIRIYDVRDERDFNLFNIGDSQRISPSEVYQPALVKRLLDFPDNTISFVVSNGESRALSSWKALKAQGVVNLYVIEGGINRWLDLYTLPKCIADRKTTLDKSSNDELLHYDFQYAVGNRAAASRPEFAFGRRSEDCPLPDPQEPTKVTEATSHQTDRPAYQYTKKVILQKKHAVKGGCG
jgi:rhodanese-related sulfurtransferase